MQARVRNSAVDSAQSPLMTWILAYLAAGTVIGFFAGGTGAWLLAKGLNLTRSDDHSVRWTLEHFIAQVEIALVTYLAVAHFGRGRGSWQDAEHPPHWPPAARTELQQYRSELETAWKKAANPDTTADSLVPEITGTITAATAALLRSLYPDIPMPWLDPANPTPGASSPVAKTVSTHASPQGS